MKVVSAAACLGISLGTLLSLPTTGHTQAPCQSLDDIVPGPTTATPRTLEAFRTASPQALQVFRELNLVPPRGRIVGGHEVAFDSNPWQIAMIRASVAEPRRSQFCGGSIIADEWVLTAAHCVRNATVREDPARVDIVVGTSQWPLGGERIKVAAIHTHPEYNEQTMDHDFALLRLQTAMTMGKTIALADASTQVDEGLQTCVTGWGATFEGGPGSIDLLGVEIPVASTETCNRPESYNGDITANMICAGREQGLVDSCQGDSGGPLTASVGGQNTLVGVVSWGEGCARRLKYGVYARVSAAAPWIKSTMGAK
jgi:secreted trypsin-like serine protease